VSASVSRATRAVRPLSGRVAASVRLTPAGARTTDADGAMISSAYAPPRGPAGRTSARVATLRMGGDRWFGEGHWFVGIGYDRNGVYIRDSSGWDNKYLTWSRLYGEVGFNARVVGAAP
jgi:hypothetical protein